MKRRVAAIFASLALAACTKPTAPAKDSGQAQPSGDKPAQAGNTAAVAPSGLQYVSMVCVMHKEPNESKTVDGPKGKKVGNWVSTLQRGEKVTLLESQEEYAQVRASDDKEGWVKKNCIFSAEGVIEATVLTPIDTFDRPDMLAMNVQRKVDAGSLILVLKNKDPFSEVSVSGTSTVWVLTNRLVTDADPIMQAKMIAKARWLKNSKKIDEAKQILASLRSQYAGSTLPDVLAADLGEPTSAELQAASNPSDAPPADPPSSPSQSADEPEGD